MQYSDFSVFSLIFTPIFPADTTVEKIWNCAYGKIGIEGVRKFQTIKKNNVRTADIR